MIAGKAYIRAIWARYVPSQTIVGGADLCNNRRSCTQAFLADKPEMTMNVPTNAEDVVFYHASEQHGTWKSQTPFSIREAAVSSLIADNDQYDAVDADGQPCTGAFDENCKPEGIDASKNMPVVTIKGANAKITVPRIPTRPRITT